MCTSCNVYSLNLNIFSSYFFFFILYRLAELDFAVSQKLDPDIADSLEYQQPKRKGRARYILAKKYFDVKEYSRLVRRITICCCYIVDFHHFVSFHRCAHYTKGCTDPVSMFLHYYSRYMAGEKTIVEDESDKSSNFLYLQLHSQHL
jgi:hypothetical protein